jgi:hypothetical protein
LEQLEVTDNGVDYTATGSNFRYHRKSIVVDLYPSSGLVQGGTEIIVLVESRDSTPPACTFGVTTVDASVIDTFELCGTRMNVGVLDNGTLNSATSSKYVMESTCMGYSTIRCISPPHTAGLASFDITYGAHLSANAVSFSFEVLAEVTLVSPTSGPAASTVVVTLSGHHMLGTHKPLCRFGSNSPSRAEFVSSALMKCEAGSHDEGEVAVEVSVSDEGQQFTANSVTFDYNSELRVLSISQVEGIHTGGTVVYLAVDSVQHGHAVSCRFGTIAPVAGKATTTHRIECLSPAHVPRSVSVDVSTNLISFTGRELMYAYRHTVSMLAVFPESAPASGGTQITISGQGFNTDMECTFGDLTVPAFNVGSQGISEVCLERGVGQQTSVYTLSGNAPSVSSHVSTRFVHQCMGWSSVICEVPPSTAGWTSVTLRMGDGELSTNDFSFGFEVGAQITHLSPDSGPVSGSTVVYLTGRHMVGHNGPLCRFGASPPSSADFVSSALIKCESTDHSQGYAEVEASMNDHGQQFTTSGASFGFATAPRLLGLGGSTEGAGAQHGGTLLQLWLTDADTHDARALECRVGTVSPMASQSVSLYEINCLTPAHAPGRVPVDVTSNRVDHTMAELAYAYRKTISVMSVYPAAAPVTGGTEVTVRGNGFDGTIECMFGEVVVSAQSLGGVDGVSEVCATRSSAFGLNPSSGLYVSHITSRYRYECIGWSAVTCLTPATVSGFTSFEVRMGKGELTTSRVTFAFDVEAQVLQVSPPFGSLYGGTIVSLSGRHMTDQNRPLCRFGSTLPSRAYFVSSAQIRCEAAEHEEGLVDVEVSVSDEGQQYSKSMILFAYIIDPRVVGMMPNEGVELGGTPLRIHGANLAPDSVIKVGTAAPISSRWLSPEVLEAVSPAYHPAGVRIPVEVGARGSNTWSTGEVAFTFTMPSELVATDLDVSSTVGGSIVTVYGTGLFLRGGTRWQCRFGDALVDAFEDATAAASVMPSESCHGTRRVPLYKDGAGNELTFESSQETGGGRHRCLGWSALSCMVPPSPAGFTTLEVAMEGEATPRASLSFSFDAAASVAAATPSESPSDGGGIVFVMGSHLRPGDGHTAPLCQFGDVPYEGAPAMAVSSALLLCEAPERAEGLVALAASVSDAGATYSALAAGAGGSSGVQHFFAYPISVAGSTPPAGPEMGGTVIALHGFGFEDSPMLACRFGTIFPVSAAFVDIGRVECVSPAHASYTVPVGVAGNGRDYSPGGGLFGSLASLHYQDNLRVTAVTPRTGVTGGRTPVFVTGIGFVNSTLLSCRMGREVVPATYLSPFSILCISPEQPSGAGTVFIEVSNNAQDFTTQRTLFHFAPCPAGYYCPEGESLPCPRGAFCGGGSGGTSNFTLCPVGTFQPRTGQASCLPSPVGFISPDSGTAAPSACPRGAVCDVTGLSGPAKGCPSGHYCLEGTRTSNFTDFGTPERPLPCPFGTYCGPGITTNRTIANNFTTPQMCYAGYLCPPGSATPQGSGPCPSGHYCPPGQLIPCPSRTHCPGVANTEPKPCVPGLYQQEYGQSTCKKCPLGTICPGFARELPEPCPPGFVCDQEGLPIPAKRCPAGHFCLANTLTSDPLSALDTDKLLRASPIRMNPDTFRPLPCLPATFCMEGVMTNKTLEGVFTQPQPCKEGSYCEWGTSDSTLAVEGDVASPMLPCPPGNYCPKGTYIPIPAPRGFFAPGEGNAQAALCLPGSYTHYEGFQKCLVCPAGYECAVDGTFKPLVCRSGTVRSLRDSITCKNCPMGTWNPFRGLTDESLCIPCNPGIVCSSEGTENNKPLGDNLAQITNQFIKPCEAGLDTCLSTELQPLGKASLCPEGYVCDARTSVAAIKCPDGYFCGHGTSPESQFVNMCPKGFFCPEGTAASGRNQFPCSACHYCPEGTGIIQPRCPEGTSSDPNSDNIDQCLADRITFWRIQPLKRTLIDEAYAMLQVAFNASNANRRRSLLEMGPGSEDERVGGVYEGGARTKYDQVISEEAMQRLGDTISAMDTLPGRNEEMQRRRRLLQIGGANIAADLDIAATGGNQQVSNSTGPAQFDATYFGECKGDNFAELNPTFIMGADGMPATDIEGTPMVKYTLPRNYIAKIKLDFRFIDDFIRHGQQYEVSLFIDDRVNDMMCAEADFERVPCPPWNVGDSINRKTMGIIPGREFEEKCPKSTEALELPFWFAANGLYGATEHNVVKPKMGTYVWKRGLHEINIGGLDEVSFRFEVRMLHGLYQNETRRGFLDSMCVDTHYPERGGKKDKASFHFILENNNELQVPLNVPFREPFQRSLELDYFLCTPTQMDPSCRFIYPTLTLDFNSTLASEWKAYIKKIELDANVGAETVTLPDGEELEMTDDVIINSDGSMNVPDVLEREDDILVRDYWGNGGQGRPLLAVDYLPFFSGCRGFDSHIYFHYLTETSWTEVDNFVNYGECKLIPVNETVFISQWAPQIAAAVADSCEVEIKCFYEESYKDAAASTRWFEVEGDTLFHITQEAETREKLFEASVLSNDQSTPEVNTEDYATAIETQETIPVAFSPADGVEVTRGIIPTEISISMSYFQFSPFDKRMIQAEGEFGEYVNAKKHDGTYLLEISTAALGWFDLLNFFAFDYIFYIALFHALGMISVAVVVAFWVFTRVFTTLKDPPRFRFMPYLRIMTQGPSQGIFLSMLPFFLAQTGVRMIIESITFFTQFPISIDNFGREIDPLIVTKATNGRMALCFLTVSCYIMTCTAEILVPRITEDSLEEDEDDSVFKPEVWKRSHYILANILINVTNVALMEFSYTDTYGKYFFTVFLLMKVFHLILEMNTEAFLGEVLLLTPISVCLAQTSGLVTIAADDFTDFTMGYYLELIIGLIEFVYLDSFIAGVAKMVPKVKLAIQRAFSRLRRRTISQQLLEGLVEEEDSVVEDLMGYLTAYGTATAGLYMTPFFIYFYWDFNDQLQLSFLFGFRKKDLLIYLLFSLVIIPFQIVMDIFTFNIQELFHGWKVYEYMKYARYRYINRTARWKGLEKVYDESIDYSLRTVDQMCFSSQFYFILGLGGSGSFLFVLSLSMMLRAQYNMFEDILFGLVVGVMIGLCVVTRKGALLMADIIGLWKISAEQMEDGMIGEEDLPTEFQTFEKAKDTERDTIGTGRGEFTMADLTTDAFRRKFLEHNRMWLLEQLSELLTPRTAKKFRKMGGNFKNLSGGGGGLSDSDSDGGENERFGEQVILSDPSHAIMRQWCHEASKRARGKFARRTAGLSETSDSDIDSRPKWPVSRLNPGAAALMKGWLAATRAVRSARSTGNREALSSSEGLSSGTDTDTDRSGASRTWGTPVLHTASQRTLLDWLSRARAQVAANTRRTEAEGGGRSGGILVNDVQFSSSDDSSSGNSGSEDGGVRRQAVQNLSTGAKRAMRQWLAAIRMRRGTGAVALGQDWDALDRDPAQVQQQQQKRLALSSSSDSDGGDDPRITAGPFDASVPAYVRPSSQIVLTRWLQEMRRKVEEDRARAGREQQAQLRDDDDDDAEEEKEDEEDDEDEDEDEDSSGDSGLDMGGGKDGGGGGNGGGGGGGGSAGPMTVLSSSGRGGNGTDVTAMSTNPTTSDQFRSGTDFDSSDY